MCLTWNIYFSAISPTQKIPSSSPAPISSNADTISIWFQDEQQMIKWQFMKVDSDNGRPLERNKIELLKSEFLCLAG